MSNFTHRLVVTHYLSSREEAVALMRDLLGAEINSLAGDMTGTVTGEMGMTEEDPADDAIDYELTRGSEESRMLLKRQEYRIAEITVNEPGA